MSELLRITGLAKSFGRKKVLRGFDLTVESGRVYGLLGLNGEGKTTLARILMGVIPADAGAVLYKGKRITYGQSDYKREFGYVPEDPFFYDDMTVRRLLDFNARFYPKWDRKRAAADLERFGLDPKARVGTLSRGQKLKLGLAAALAAGPELLILDDPTSGLDVPTRQEFLRDVIRELAASGTTILFASHLVHELERICDWVGVMDDGALVAELPMQAFKNGIKRIKVAAAPADLPDLPFSILSREPGNGSAPVDTWIVRGWEDSMRAWFDSAGMSLRDVIDLDLEDGFVELLRSSRPKNPHRS